MWKQLWFYIKTTMTDWRTYVAIVGIILAVALASNKNSAVDVTNLKHPYPFTIKQELADYHTLSKEFVGDEKLTVDNLTKMIDDEQADKNAKLIPLKTFYGAPDSFRHQPYRIKGTLVRKLDTSENVGLCKLDTGGGYVFIYFIPRNPVNPAGTIIDVRGIVLGSVYSQTVGKPIPALVSIASDINKN